MCGLGYTGGIGDKRKEINIKCVTRALASIVNEIRVGLTTQRIGLGFGFDKL